MHPAYSIIFFTTASGFGYGLAAVLGMGVLDPSLGTTKAAYFFALALISTGLMSSALHLGNPQRAWRAFSQWRSSWLSREGVMAIITFVPLCASAWLSIFEDRHVMWIGLAGAALALVTVYCTSMIYASLKSIQAWHTPLTSVSYILFAIAGGLSLACAFAALEGVLTRYLLLSAMVALAGAWVAKFIWRGRMENERPLSTPESATGLGGIGKVRLLDPPHMTSNYLTSEMGYRVARKHAAKLAAIAMGFGGAIPVGLFGVAMVLPVSATIGNTIVLSALAFHILGVVVERWLFFAEARHAVMNYYGR